jgi:hypothetical protein
MKLLVGWITTKQRVFCSRRRSSGRTMGEQVLSGRSGCRGRCHAELRARPARLALRFRPARCACASCARATPPTGPPRFAPSGQARLAPRCAPSSPAGSGSGRRSRSTGRSCGPGARTQTDAIARQAAVGCSCRGTYPTAPHRRGGQPESIVQFAVDNSPA